MIVSLIGIYGGLLPYMDLRDQVREKSEGETPIFSWRREREKKNLEIFRSNKTIDVDTILFLRGFPIQFYIVPGVNFSFCEKNHEE